MNTNQNPTINDLQGQANEIKHLTFDQLCDVMKLARDTSARDHAMLVVCYQHALRASEVATIKLDDIQWREMTLTVERKKGSLRTVQNLFQERGRPELDEVRALKRWIAERKQTGEPTSYLFASQRGGDLHPDVVNRIFKGYVAKVNETRLAAGKQPIDKDTAHIHSLKHTRVTLLLDAGMDFYRVGLIAGHAALSSTLRYSHGSQALACQEAQSKAYEMA
jgi:site-specific recombinase XerD